MEAGKLINDCISSLPFLVLIAIPISITLIQHARSHESTHVSNRPMTTVGTLRKPII